LSQKDSKKDAQSRRIRERVSLGLLVRVRCRESADRDWEEVSRLIDVTPFGARLRLKRPVEIGRLLLLTMAMPRQLRCFDHVEDQYKVWSLVRNLTLLDPQTEKGAIVEIGVAFVGKRPPQSFQANPATRYQIARTKDNETLWAVNEESDEILEEMPSERRRATRHSIPIEMLVEPFSEEGNFSSGESTVTENVSSRGALVFTTLNLPNGRFVRVTSPQHSAQILAVVRDRRTGADGIPRLHLEFVGSEWPL